MRLPIQYLPLPPDMPDRLRVRVFHGQSQTTGWLSGFTLASDGAWVNLMDATTVSELAPAWMETKRLPLMSIHLDGVRMVLEHGGQP